MSAPRSVRPDRTVVKVRGKTRRLSIERKGLRARRPSVLRQSLASHGSDHVLSGDLVQKTKSRRRRRSFDHETPLETLPPEIVQLIFEYSANLELSLASPQMAVMLSQSQHLKSQLTDKALYAVTGEVGKCATDIELMQARRLLNSRFMTWNFFSQWLRRNSADVASSRGMKSEMKERWSSLSPSPRLMPPTKLLRGPFTTAKLQFLDVLAQSLSDIEYQHPVLGETAREGLKEAVITGHPGFVASMLAMGLRTDTDLLRTAVVRGGCDRNIVQILLTRSGAAKVMGVEADMVPSDDLDLHDPAIWAWAGEHAESGEWLKSFLLDTQRKRERAQAIKARNPGL